MAKGVFLDRDGVINKLLYYPEQGIIDSPFTVEQFKLLPGVGQSIKLLNQRGFRVIVVSNQPGVARSHFAMETLQEMDAKMRAELEAQGAFIDGIYYCPHHPDGEREEYRLNCNCRKPQPGLLLQAAEEFRLDLGQSYMVGDNLSDVLAGRRAGCRTLLIGKMKCNLCNLMEQEGAKPDAIVGDLSEAVRTIAILEAGEVPLAVEPSPCLNSP